MGQSSTSRDITTKRAGAAVDYQALSVADKITRRNNSAVAVFPCRMVIRDTDDLSAKIQDSGVVLGAGEFYHGLVMDNTNRERVQGSSATAGYLQNELIPIARTGRFYAECEEAVAEGSFRSDLYYRIFVLTVRVPPLRVRGSDIILLARHFLDKVTKQYGRQPIELTAEAEAGLLGHTWPGNVRELAHMMERVGLLHRGTAIRSEHLDLSGGKDTPVLVETNGKVKVDFSAGGITLEEVIRYLIIQALEETKGNQTRAAQLLGISKETLRYRVEKYQLRTKES